MITIAAGQRDEEWKSSPGHMSAAMMNTRLYNNAAAAESDDEEDDSCSTSGSSQTGSTVHQRDVEVNETQPDPQAAQILEAATQLSNYPTVDTLTPATSSEDIFYSPIAHSTPTSEPKDQPTEMVNTSTAQTPEPEPPKPQKEVHQQNQQQPQRQRNHSHQRYRGRNRR
ncbi:hypothetical protein M5D96_009983 [Drosophila gunungcola]|uniref:Uncharacterized protein n=1 Tax=Drosophila gunungcola TaxID=103775 RepID=A0A9Q0BLT9_9MUSC|nr:hypothetical protein M5D96_009983 [Drosophila gunungcola]